MAIAGHASGAAVVGVTIAFTVLAAIVVVSRLFARITIVKKAGLDDAFIVAALIFSIATTVTMILQVKWGMGQHIYTLTLNDGIQSQKAFYVSIWVYNLSMSCTKFSILLQYLRIFPQNIFRTMCFVMIGIITIYTCWTFFSAVFACWPISYFWTQLADPKSGHCLNRFAVWFANAGINIGTDIATGLLPLRVLKDLQLPKRQKIALMVVFGLGGFTCVVSILRLQSLYVISRSKDVTWQNPLAAIWSSVEINTGILCSCLPTLRSFVSRFFPRFLETFRGSVSYDSSEHGHRQESFPSQGSGGSRGKYSGSTLQHSKNGSRGPRRKMSFDELGRGLTGKEHAVQNSMIYSHTQPGDSEEDVEFSTLWPLPGVEEDRQIHVTTMLEQDIEKLPPVYNPTERLRPP